MLTALGELNTDGRGIDSKHIAPCFGQVESIVTKPAANFQDSRTGLYESHRAQHCDVR